MDKPKRGMTAYMYFTQTCRDEHKKKHPNETLDFALFSKSCSERWKSMDGNDKGPFLQMAVKDKKRFDAEMVHYKPVEGEQNKRGKKRKRTKDPNAPKRSLSAYFWYINDERPKVKETLPKSTVGEIAKELGRRWNVVTKEIKSKYEALAAKDKARYEREMKAYKGKGSPTMMVKGKKSKPTLVKDKKTNPALIKPSTSKIQEPQYDSPEDDDEEESVEVEQEEDDEDDDDDD